MRGGKREGAGRPPGRPPGAITKAKRELADMARDHAEAALKTLVSIARDTGAPAAARVTASSAILDRGYGKPPQFNTNSAAEFKRATEMTDDELARIAAGGSTNADPAESVPQITH